jgi:hypothetical protein
MCVVNAYLAYCHWHPDGEDTGLRAFTQAVALHLLRGDEAPARRSSASTAEPAVE